MVVPEDGAAVPRQERRALDRRSRRIGDGGLRPCGGRRHHTVIAARNRGATVVAFEPDTRPTKICATTCSSNGCDRRRGAACRRVGRLRGVGTPEVPLGNTGQSATRCQRAVEASRPAGEGRPLVQPCARPRSNRAVERYELPSANHLRIGNMASVPRRDRRGGRHTWLSARCERCSSRCSTPDREGNLERWRARASASDVKPLRRGRTHAIFARPA